MAPGSRGPICGVGLCKVSSPNDQLTRLLGGVLEVSAPPTLVFAAAYPKRSLLTASASGPGPCAKSPRLLREAQNTLFADRGLSSRCTPPTARPRPAPHPRRAPASQGASRPRLRASAEAAASAGSTCHPFSLPTFRFSAMAVRRCNLDTVTHAPLTCPTSCVSTLKIQL